MENRICICILWQNSIKHQYLSKNKEGVACFCKIKRKKRRSLQQYLDVLGIYLSMGGYYAIYRQLYGLSEVESSDKETDFCFVYCKILLVKRTEF